jgi:hypothetical protein
VQRARSGAIECDGAFLLFGAAIQQLLSHLKSMNGAPVKASELAAVFDSHQHLDPTVVAGILSELAAQTVLTRHDYKERFGVGEQFHLLDSLHLLYSNYPAGAQTISLKHHGREIGRIPAINLLRLGTGSCFRFGSRIYSVRHIDHKNLEVESGNAKEKTIPLTYLGRGPGLQAQIAEDVREILSNCEIDDDLVGSQTRAVVEKLLARVGPVLRDGRIPVLHSPEGFRYLTFGGTVFNASVALWSGAEGSRSDDVCAVSDAPIQFSQLPDRLDSMPKVARSSERSMFQSMLPPNLAELETQETWLKTKAHAHSLERLRSGVSHPMEASFFQGLI